MVGFSYGNDLGCHIDGFVAVVAHTHVLQEGPVTGRASDVIAAANTAAEVALRLVRPGKKVIVLDNTVSNLFHSVLMTDVAIDQCARIRDYLD